MTVSDVTCSADELAEIREELRAVARDLLGKAGAGPGSRAGTGPGGGAGAEPGWDQLAVSGWLGLEIPDELGGAGVTLAEAAVIAEELGRAAARPRTWARPCSAPAPC